jgi:hypothetical protein
MEFEATYQPSKNVICDHILQKFFIVNENNGTAVGYNKHFLGQYHYWPFGAKGEGLRHWP